VNFIEGEFKAIPALYTGLQNINSANLITGSTLDGNINTALFTNNSVKDLSIQSVLTDGINGLNLGTGYSNLNNAESFIKINSINSSKILDNEPDILIAQIGNPGDNPDTYSFLDENNQVVGNSLNPNFQNILSLGNYKSDIYTVPNILNFSEAKPNGVAANGTNTTTEIRVIGLKLSDFGISISNYSQVKTFKTIASGNFDIAFVAYNKGAFNIAPSIIQNTFASNSIICNSGNNNAMLSVIGLAANGGTLTYSWEVSTDNGTSWNLISNSSMYSGTTSSSLAITNAILGYKYRATVLESGTQLINTCSVFTITTTTDSALGGTLDPNNITNCINTTSGTTSLTVNPTGGTNSYSYQWSTSLDQNGTYTAINGAVYNTYNPPLDSAGTKYYKVMINSGCYNNLSNAANVTLSGENPPTITNTTICSPGTVTLNASSLSGEINWYNTATGGSSIATGSSYTTSISSSTTYYASTTVASCVTPRVPVIATVTNTITLDSSNFGIIYARDACPGSNSYITFSSSNTQLLDGQYTASYYINGTNTVASTTSSLITVSGGFGNFYTENLNTPGSNTITITSINIASSSDPNVVCTIPVNSGNSAQINVLDSLPNISDLHVSVSSGCSDSKNKATVTSTTLANGIYTVSYHIIGTNNSGGYTNAQMTFTNGIGRFNLPYLLIAGNDNIVSILSITRTGTTCTSTLDPEVATLPFTTYIQPTVNAGSSLSICASESIVTIGANASASNYSTLNWSTTDGSGTFADSHALTTTYSPSASDLTHNQIHLTLTATPGNMCNDVSKTIILNISPITNAGLTSEDQIICYNTSTTISLTGSVGTIQWKSSVNGVDWINVTGGSGGTTDSYTTPLLTVNTMYKAVVKSGVCNEMESAVITITINSLTNGGTISGSNGVCNGINSSTLTLTNYNGSILKWQSSADFDFSGTIVDIAYTSNQINITNLNNTMYYRALVQSGVCNSQFSDIGTILVYTNTIGGTVSDNQTICYGSKLSDLTLTGQNGSILRWESSNDDQFSINNTISNTSTTLTGNEVGNLLKSTYLRAVIKNGACTTEYSNSILITINTTFYNGTSWSDGDPTISNTKSILIDCNSCNYNFNYPISGCSFNVKNNAQVVLESGNNIVLSGAVNIENGSSLTIQNNAHLLQTSNSTNTGNIVIHRLSSPLFRLDYTLWSSPVTGTQTLSNFSPLTTVGRFYTFNTLNNVYNSISSTSNFELAKGYLIRMPNNWIPSTTNGTPNTAMNFDGIFNGVPNNGDINFTLTLASDSDPNKENHRFNAIGNPYPSPLNINNFINNNNYIEGTLWFWRRTNGQNDSTAYSTCTTIGCTINNNHTNFSNSNNLIEVGQGFIVKGIDLQNNIVNFTNSMRVNSNPNQFFRTNTTLDRFWLQLKKEDNSPINQFLLAFLPNATLLYDTKLDGLFKNDINTSLTAIRAARELVIEARPTFNDQDIVPLSFKTDVAGNYIISLSTLEGIFNTNQTIYLKDILIGTYQNLKDADYTFSSDIGVFSDRFQLAFSLNTLSNSQSNGVVENNVVVFKNGNNIIVNSGNKTLNSVKIYDCKGQLLYQNNTLNSNSLTVKSDEFANQVLFIKTQTEDHTVVTKKL